MTHQSLTAVIETLRPPPAASDLDQLAQLLMGAVDSGAGVSSVLPFSVAAGRVVADDARTRRSARWYL
jgi:hypothetical protein